MTWRGTDQFGNLSAPAAQRVTVDIGDDQSCYPVGANVIVGTSNNDVLNGAPGRDCIQGKGAQYVYFV